MVPRNTRSKRLPDDGNLSSNAHRSDPTFSKPTCSSSRNKNPRKRSRSSDDDEACPAPPKKHINSRRPRPTADSFPVAKRPAPRRSARKVARSHKKVVPEPADPDPDAIIIDDDGYPYVAYDDAPHLHPPPRRYKQSEPSQPAEQVKGCSIKPCWTPAQRRRCELLQTDPAVEAIGWKKVRKWMQAVRCRLCGEAQVLRDLTKGCFNLEHWWRHLRVRHGIKREEEIQDKGEEKYKTLPIKDHVCVGACSTCGEGGTAVSTFHLETSHAAQGVAVKSSDLSRLSSVEPTPDPPREYIPEASTSTLCVQRPSPAHSPKAGPSNTNSPPVTSDLYTLANARPQYESIGALTSYPTSACWDLPPSVPQSWAGYIDPSMFNIPLGPLPAPRHMSTGNSLNTSTPQSQQIKPQSSTSLSPPSPCLPAVRTAPTIARSEADTIDVAHTLLSLNRSGPPDRTLASIRTGPSSPPATRSRSRFRSTAESALPLTLLPTATSASSIRQMSGGPPPSSTVPGPSSYRPPPVNTIPIGAPSPPLMMPASWEHEESNTEEEGQIADLQRNVRTKDTNPKENRVVAPNGMAASAMRHRYTVPAWGDRSDDQEMINSVAESISAQALPCVRGYGEGEEATERGSLQQPEWAFIKQEESEPDMDEDDEDMVDQLIGDR